MIERVRALVAAHGALLRELIGYVAVSALALGVDFLVYWMLLDIADIAAIPAAIGYMCGLVVHYLLASRLVFVGRLTRHGVAAEAPTFAKYLASGVLGLVLTAGIVGVCAELLDWNPITAKVLATAVAFVAVYLARRYVVFGSPAVPASA